MGWDVRLLNWNGVSPHGIYRVILNYMQEIWRLCSVPTIKPKSSKKHLVAIVFRENGKH
jgi:hypothetical protein